MLVVDDEPDARGLVKRLLEDAGARVARRHRGRAALEILERDSSPTSSSATSACRIRMATSSCARCARLAGLTWPSVPAAALTALARVEDRKRALMAGYQTHLAKPVDPTELVAMVATLTGRTGDPWPDGATPPADMRLSSIRLQRSWRPARAVLVHDRGGV